MDDFDPTVSQSNQSQQYSDEPAVKQENIDVSEQSSNSNDHKQDNNVFFIQNSASADFQNIDQSSASSCSQPSLQASSQSAQLVKQLSSSSSSQIQSSSPPQPFEAPEINRKQQQQEEKKQKQQQGQQQKQTKSVEQKQGKEQRETQEQRSAAGGQIQNNLPVADDKQKQQHEGRETEIKTETETEVEVSEIKKQENHQGQQTQQQQQPINLAPAAPPQPLQNVFQLKLNEAIQCKIKGNQAFKSSMIEDAVMEYSQGLKILNPNHFYGANQAQLNKLAQVSAVLLNNLGSCYFSMKKWVAAEIYYSQAITINQNYTKALYKRALTRFQLQKYQTAMEDIKKAFSLDKGNADIHISYEKILTKYNQTVRKEKEKMKEMSSKIFKRSESQRSINSSARNEDQSEFLALSRAKSQNDKNCQSGAFNCEKGKDQDGSDFTSSAWALAPVVLIAGVALYAGYKKWFKSD